MLEIECSWRGGAKLWCEVNSRRVPQFGNQRAKLGPDFYNSISEIVHQTVESIQAIHLRQVGHMNCLYKAAEPSAEEQLRVHFSASVSRSRGGANTLLQPFSLLQNRIEHSVHFIANLLRDALQTLTVGAFHC